MVRKNIADNLLLVTALAALLFFPAFLINLGKDLLIEDEAIRGLVAFEMGQRGDLISPTLFGELYLKKPPLYNWIILAFFNIFTSHSEFVLRLPMVIFLALFVLTIYFTLRKEMGHLFALLLSLMFLTNGRVIIYESLHGLIDIAFSWVIYCFFMVVYFYSKRQAYTRMFLLSYLLLSVAYLMKGLPAIAFGGITLLSWCTASRSFRRLFHPAHFAGIILFLLITGGYYLKYFIDNEIAFSNLFGVIFHESAQRTAMFFDLKTIALHILAFPFELFYHFFPYTLLAVFLFRRDFRSKLREKPFIRFSAVVFFFNMLLYWLSPQVYARYLIMLVPLMYAVLIYFYLDHKERTTLRLKIVEYFMVLIILAIAALSIVPVFDPVTGGYPLAIPKVAVLFIASLLTLFFYLRSHTLRLLWMVLALLVLRIGMNWFVLPHRMENNSAVEMRQEATEIGRAYRDEPMYSLWDPSFEENFYFGKSIIQYRYMYYLSVAREGLVQYAPDLGKEGLYIAQKRQLAGKGPYEVVRELQPERVSATILLVRTISEE